MGNGQLGAAKKKPNRRKGLTFAQQAGIVLGSGTLVAAAIGAYLVITYANSSVSHVASSSMLRDNTGSIIARSANGDGCHRKKFDNVTGTISDDGPTSCAAVDSPSSSTAASGRFGAIANGFRH